MKKNTILISGASGVLGSKLVKMLNTRGNNVFALGRDKKKIQNACDMTRNHCFDYTDFLSGKVFKTTYDIMIHCAFSRSFSGLDLAQSIQYSKELFQSCITNNVKFIINISSQSIYGEGSPPLWDENTLPALEGTDKVYALAKYSTEIILESICSVDSAAYTNIRLASLVGEDMNERIVSRLVSNALNTNKLEIYGGEHKIFSFLDIRDAVDAICCVAECSAQDLAPVYNLGPYLRYTLSEIAEITSNIVFNKTENLPEIIHIPDRDMLDTGMNSELFYKKFNWKPKYDMYAVIDNISDLYLSTKNF